MAFELMPLPYDSEALAPAISAETLSFHHGKHHKAYIDKTNKAIEGTELADADLETVIAKAREGDQGLFNNAAQSWNHGFYWHSLSPDAQEPVDELAQRIEADFGSLAELKAQLADRDGVTPLLTIDVWEHAYYLDHQNQRPSYLKEVIEKHLNWSFAAENLARGATWKYPAPAYAD